MKPINVNSLLAAFMFFTRLPFWRIKEVEKEYFKNVVHYWPYVGILTGGVMSLVLWSTAMVLPYSVAVICAIISRIILTGALHEDGLADFFDGFGGGTSKARILEIMKDSHIGSYGVISLIMYYLIFYSIIVSIPLQMAVFILLAGDITAKFIASQIVNFLPYAKKEEECKIKVIYNRIPIVIIIINLIFTTCAMYFLLPYWLRFAPIGSVILFLLLMLIMRRKIQGYTGDCCGATFLMCELAFYLTTVGILNIIS
ncbi:MAG: adenosylcobinamide-GDP ribazoletransferase [Bacteroidales bacterium]